MGKTSIVGRREISVRSYFDSDDWTYYAVVNQKRFKQTLFNRVKVKETRLLEVPVPRITNRYNGSENVKKDQMEMIYIFVNQYAESIVENDPNAVFVGDKLTIDD